MEIAFIDEQHLVTPEKIQDIDDLLQYAGNYIELPSDTEMSVTFMNNAEIQAINREYRKKATPTDLIS